MTILKKTRNKLLVLSIASVLVIGGTTYMTYAASRGVSSNITTIDKSNGINPTVEYTLIDNSKVTEEYKTQMRTKLSMQKGITPEQIDKQLSDLVASLTPSSKDISVQQAAVYGANSIKKTFAAELKGFTAYAIFHKASNSSSGFCWDIQFKSPELIESEKNAASQGKRCAGKYYIATVDSVKGTMLDTSFGEDLASNDNGNLSDPAWIDAAKKCVSTYISKDVTITNAKVVNKGADVGVTVVCKLSNGSAYGVRLVGKDKLPAFSSFFPHGYDGTLDKMTPADIAKGKG